jgi:predicted metalloprotease with PDZ domain
MRLAVHHNGSEEYVDAYADMAKAVVAEEKAVWGEFPQYDYGTYTFIADYLPYVYGDGMEHRNSTIIASTGSLKANAVGLLGTLAHEFFHGWNVRRLRPKSLEPFDFTKANMSEELWFAEGFTSYYGDLTMCRAQIVSIDRFAKDISGTLNYVINGPGRKYFSAAEMSAQAPFVDAATSVDEQNRGNTFVSYYSYGEAIALGLDLTLRTKFHGMTLDDVMRKAWELYGKPFKPYTIDDLKGVLATATNDSEFANSFFERYILGHEVVDYEKLLANAGMILRNARRDKAWLGNAAMRYDDGKAVISAPTTMGTPYYRAGLDRSDRIIRIDGMAITSAKDIDSVLSKHKPGESTTIDFEQRGSMKSASVVFAANSQLEVVRNEQASLPVTDEMVSFREQWLGTKVKEKLPELTKTCSKCKRKFPFKYEFCQFDGDSLKVVAE